MYQESSEKLPGYNWKNTLKVPTIYCKVIARFQASTGKVVENKGRNIRTFFKSTKKILENYHKSARKL